MADPFTCILFAGALWVKTPDQYAFNLTESTSMVVSSSVLIVRNANAVVRIPVEPIVDLDGFLSACKKQVQNRETFVE